MSYTPVNVSVYVAAFAGAVAAMSMSDRVIASQDTAAYNAQVNAAGAFAQEFDIQWGTRNTSTLDLTSITQAASQSYILRTPSSVKLSDYVSIVSAIITAITGVENYFTAQGITPPSPNTIVGSGLRVIPPVDQYSQIRWDWSIQTDGVQPAYGIAPTAPIASVGAQNVPLLNGFATGQGGIVVQPGPFGRSGDFYTGAGTSAGGSYSANNPYNPGQNQSMTLEAGFFARSLPAGNGPILNKAWRGSQWSAPFNSMAVTWAASHADSQWEIGMTDSADTSVEIGFDIVVRRDAIRIGFFNHVMLVIDVANKIAVGYLNGTKRGSFTFPTGPAYFVGGDSGPYLVGGNNISGADSSDVVYDYTEVANVARTPAEALSRAQQYLGYLIPKAA